MPFSPEQFGQFPNVVGLRPDAIDIVQARRAWAIRRLLQPPQTALQPMSILGTPIEADTEKQNSTFLKLDNHIKAVKIGEQSW